MITISTRQRMELGAERCKHRWRLREVMDVNGVPSYAALGRMLGVSSVAVARTVKGEIHSPVVLDWFRAHGVAETQLCDPHTLAK